MSSELRDPHHFGKEDWLVHVWVHVLLIGILAGVAAACTIAGHWFDRHIRGGRTFRAVVVGASGVPLALNIASMWIGGDDVWQATAMVMSVVGLSAAAAAAVLLRIVPGTVKHARRVLAIGAHPDDLELACGGTLAKLSDAGHEVHALVMSDGASGGDAAQRPGHARVGARFMGLASVVVHGFTDTALATHEVELVRAIERAMRAIGPDIILTHSGHDQHQDHQAVYAATLRAARQHSSILCYESPSVTKHFTPSVFVDINDYVDVKVAAVRAHRDQTGKPYMSAERVRSAASFRGAQAKRRYAEGFEPVRVLGTDMGDL